jgi:Guanylate kinase
VISSPSGAGKTTIAKKLTYNKKNIKLSVSLTTRKPRKGEVDGVHYKFVSIEFFKRKLNKKLFLSMLGFLEIFMEHSKKILLKN